MRFDAFGSRSGLDFSTTSHTCSIGHRERPHMQGFWNNYELSDMEHWVIGSSNIFGYAVNMLGWNWSATILRSIVQFNCSSRIKGIKPQTLPCCIHACGLLVSLPCSLNSDYGPHHSSGNVIHRTTWRLDNAWLSSLAFLCESEMSCEQAPDFHITCDVVCDKRSVQRSFEKIPD